MKQDETSTLDIRYDANGLIAAVVQDAHTKDVLMVAWMNNEAFSKTLTTGEAHFWSRSRQELWHKGATSGHVQRIREIRIDCDQDCVLLFVEPQGPACHTGRRTCFYRRVDAQDGTLVFIDTPL